MEERGYKIIWSKIAIPTFLGSKIMEKYRHFLKRLFENARHVLSESEEKIMNLKSTPSYSMWVNMTESFLAKEEMEVVDEPDLKTRKKTFSDLFGMINRQKKEVRDSAAKALNEILAKYADIAESEINAVLLDKKINDELRGFSEPEESRLIADDISAEIVDALTKAITENFGISRRFYGLKSKLLGLKKLKYHERNVPYDSAEKEYNYKDSINLVNKVFSKLDPKFSEILKKFSENGQIDVFPRKGKSGGAFCVYMLKKNPSYVMLNHTGKLKDVMTIAHELGHAINNEFVKDNQDAIYFGTPTSTAEVASTFMEDFVLEELIKNSDDELKLAIMMEKLNDDVSTIIRQISCYAFEKELHAEFRKNGYLSKEEIGKIFQKHMKNYMGDFVEQSEGSENWWVYWSHIRRFFYVYSYASGLIISKALQKKVRENPEYIEKVKKFMSQGLSKSPKDIFMEIGIDITKKEFWSGGIKEVGALLDKTEKLAKKLGKI